MRKYVKRLAYAGGAYIGKRLLSAGYNKALSFAKRQYSRFKKRKSKSYRVRAVTQQRDSKVTRVSGRNSRRFQRFRARVRAALQADNPKHVYQTVYKASGSASDSVAGFDGAYFLDLNTTNQGDLYNVFKDAHGLATSGDYDNYRVYLKSAYTDFMVSNTNSTHTAEVDIYECIARRDSTDTSTPGDMWTNYFNDLDAVGTVTKAHPSMTPYLVPNFVRSWKIIRSTKYLIEPGKTVSMNMASRLNKVMTGLKLANSVTVVKNLTRMFFFRVRGAAKDVTATGTNPSSGLTAWNVAWSCLTTINYQTMPTSDQSDDIDQSK